MGRDLGIQQPEKVLLRLKSSQDLQRTHNQWLVRFIDNAKDKGVEGFKERYGDAVFPEPPLKGTETIVPVCTIEALYAEGAAMHNCVGVYATRVMEGRSYIYSVLSPQRATLELAIHGKNVFIQQLLLESNKPPAIETKNAVEEWVKSSSPA